MKTDLPSVFFGPGEAPHNPPPVQQLLFGAATCLAGSIMLLAAQKGLDIDELCVTVDSDANFTCLLTENDTELPASALRIKVEVKPDDAKTLGAVQQIAERAKRNAPGMYLIANPMPISLEVVGAK